MSLIYRAVCWQHIFFFNQEDAVSIISQKIFGFWSIRSQDRFPLCLSPSYLLGPREGCSASGTSNHLCQWQWDFLHPRGDFHYTIKSVFNAVLPKGWRITAFDWLLPFVQRFFLIILYTVHKKHPNFWQPYMENYASSVVEVFAWAVSHSSKPLLIFTSEKQASFYTHPCYWLFANSV